MKQLRTSKKWIWGLSIALSACTARKSFSREELIEIYAAEIQEKNLIEVIHKYDLDKASVRQVYQDSLREMIISPDTWKEFLKEVEQYQQTFPEK